MLLPQRVNEGDLIVFGFVLSTHLLIIDTIICVSKVAELPQQGGEFVLREGFDLFRKDVCLDGIDWATFSRSRCYSLNLIDSAPGGNHHRAFLKPHLMVIGRRCAPPASIPGDALLNRFLDGEGFNFIPLTSTQDSIAAEVKKRPGLFVKRFSGASSILKHSITALSDQDARRLLQLVFTQADTLVLDPLEPRTQLVRTLPSGAASC